MWPWLVGAGVIALLATSSGKTVARAPLAPSTPSHGVVSNNVPLTPANIQKAQAVALAHETNTANLTSFGTALVAYGYATLGNALINKTLTHTQAAARDPVASGEGAWVPFWVNKFAGAHYASNQAISASDLAKAVHNAIASGTADELTGFANALTAIGQSAYALQLQAQVAALKGHPSPAGHVSVPSPAPAPAHVATKPGTYTTTHGHVKTMTAAQKASQIAQLQADLTAHGGFGAPSAADAARIRKQIKALQATVTVG